MAAKFFLRFFSLQSINSETLFGGARRIIFTKHFAALDVAFRKYCQVAYVGTFRSFWIKLHFFTTYMTWQWKGCPNCCCKPSSQTPICLWHVYLFSIMNEHLHFAAWIIATLAKLKSLRGSKKQNPATSDITSHNLFPNAALVTMSWSRVWNDISVGRFADQVFVKWCQILFWAKLEKIPPLQPVCQLNIGLPILCFKSWISF